MKITNIYQDYKKDLEIKDQKYKKTAIVCYITAAVFIALNLLINLLMLIDNSYFQIIWMIVLIINNYVINFVFLFFYLVNFILQTKINFNLHSKLCLVGFIILLTITISLIVLI